MSNHSQLILSKPSISFWSKKNTTEFCQSFWGPAVSRHSSIYLSISTLSLCVFWSIFFICLSVYLLINIYDYLLYLSICLSVCVCIYPSIYLNDYLSVCLYISIRLSSYIFKLLSIYLSVHLYMYLSIYLSTCISVSISLCISVYLFVFFCIHIVQLNKRLWCCLFSLILLIIAANFEHNSWWFFNWIVSQYCSRPHF